MLKQLEPRYDSRKSFYGKAHIWTDENSNEIILISYHSEAARYVNGHLALNSDLSDDMLFSKTTLRHIKEFVRQISGLSLTKKQLENEVERVSFEKIC